MVVKTLNAADIREACSIPGLGRLTGGGHPLFLPGESHLIPGQRIQVGCSPMGHKELDMTEVT